MHLSVVIPTYNRGSILLDTIRQLLNQSAPADEIIIVDQTRYLSGDEVSRELAALHEKMLIRWVQKKQPSIPKAMNVGLKAASFDWVLFLDDDINVAADFIQQHKMVITDSGALAHVGQVVQPWQQANGGSVNQTAGETITLRGDLRFVFNAALPHRMQNCMAGNLCVNRMAAIEAGGFDENFYGVAYRFETEFCKRFCRRHLTLFHYAPGPILNHLHHQSGGTRAHAHHLRSGSPAHSMGDYYFALLHGRGFDAMNYCMKRFVTSIVARFYLRRPWFIPLRLMAESRGFLSALVAINRGPLWIKDGEND